MAETRQASGASREHAPKPVSSLCGITSYVLLAATSLFVIAFLLYADIQRVISIVPDDAAYYFKIAENASAGKGLTFDGLNQTNGFQPLWLYTILPVSAVYRGTPETMFRLYLILQVSILAVSLLVIYSPLSRLFAAETATICVVVFLFMVFIPSVNGMETAILILAMTILFAYGLHGEGFFQFPPGKSFVFGLLLGLCVLSRLDMIFLALTIGSTLSVRIIAGTDDRREGLQRLALVVLGAATLVLPYLCFNLTRFGGMLPISASLKMSFPEGVVNHEVLRVSRPYDLVSLFVVASYALWYWLKRRPSEADRTERCHYRSGLAIFSVAVMVHFLYIFLFVKWGVSEWYFTSYALVASLILCEPLDSILKSRRVAKRKRWLLWPTLAAVLIVGVSETSKSFGRDLDQAWQSATYNAAVWARNNTEPSDVLAMSNAGNFAYFSERAVVNLDGVVNNLEYQNAIREKGLAEYLEKRDVKYISQHAFWFTDEINRGGYGTYPWHYFSHAYSTNSDPILLREDCEAYRSPYNDGPHETAFVIWRWCR